MEVYHITIITMRLIFFQILYTGVEILLRFNIFLRYGCICHILGPKPLAQGCINFTIFIEGFMDIITVHLIFFLSVKVEKIFETWFFFSKLAMRFRGGKIMNYTIKIIIEMLQISWLFSFQ